MTEGIEQRRRPVLPNAPVRQKNHRGQKRRLVINEKVRCGRFRRVIDRRGWMLTEAITMLARLSHVRDELHCAERRHHTHHPPIDGQQEQESS